MDLYTVSGNDIIINGKYSNDIIPKSDHKNSSVNALLEHGSVHYNF